MLAEGVVGNSWCCPSFASRLLLDHSCWDGCSLCSPKKDTHITYSTHAHITHAHSCPHKGIQSTVRASMEESLVQILSPKRRIDILRDVMGKVKGGKPYVITFCGVNGVGKSTNLAKASGRHTNQQCPCSHLYSVLCT